MLIVTRKINDRIIIDGQTEITLLEIGRNRVRLGINAPKEIKIESVAAGSIETGIILYRLFTGRVPDWYGSQCNEIRVRQNLPLSFDETDVHCPTEIRTLIRDMLRVDPKERSTAQQALTSLRRPLL